MKSKYVLWLVVGGLLVDLADAFTTKAGQTGGIFYGASGLLNGFDNSLPGGLHPGELAAAVGAAMMFMEHHKR